MLSDVTISNIKRYVLMDKEIKEIIDKIQEIESKNSLYYVNGIVTAEAHILRRLYNKLHVLVEDKNMLQLFLETLDVEFLYEISKEIYKSEDENKDSYIEYINELIKDKKEKEMVR
ncbi:MAG: hypothetical protein E7163_00810 [Firmicutes bacterium]|nr:hypothetical protein [Bacillota bacterium]